MGSVSLGRACTAWFRTSDAFLRRRRPSLGAGQLRLRSEAVCPPPTAEYFPLAQPVQAALNEQIGAELDASLGYLAMATSMSAVSVSLRGAAAMFLANAEEERGHALLLVRWLAARGGCFLPRDIRPAAAAPVAEASTPAGARAWEVLNEAVGSAVAMERQVTDALLRVHGVARSCRDVATADLISRSMLAEQVETLYFLGQLHTRLQNVKDSPQGLLLLDEMLYKKFKS